MLGHFGAGQSSPRGPSPGPSIDPGDGQATRAQVQIASWRGLHYFHGREAGGGTK